MTGSGDYPRLTFDAAGNLRTEDNAGTPGAPRVALTHTWDHLYRRTALTTQVYNAQGIGLYDFRESFAYDDLSRVTRVRQYSVSGGASLTDKRADFTWNAAGENTQVRRDVWNVTGFSQVATGIYARDGLGRLTGLTYTHSTTTIADYDWTFDAASRVTSFVSSNDGTSDYSYDNINQVTAADHTYQTDEAYSFDGTGNRVRKG